MATATNMSVAQATAAIGQQEETSSPLSRMSDVSGASKDKASADEEVEVEEAEEDTWIFGVVSTFSQQKHRCV